MTNSIEDSGRWYAGITRYQWLVLLVASLGWMFDVFEGQIFVASMNEAMPSLVPAELTADQPDPGQARDGLIRFYNNVTLGSFLLGGALGGVLFGILSDRIGRTRTMVYTILMYSAFTSISAFSQTWWHLAICRFLVAMGVGGEWAVASAMVAEVFPRRARAWSLGIFHASSVFGTYLATAAGMFIVGNVALKSEKYPGLEWRLGFLLGAVPALLTIWIRMSLREPDQWQAARDSAVKGVTKKLGSFADLFRDGLAPRTLIGVTLAGVGLATFWGAHIYGKDLLREKRKVELLATLPADTPADEQEAFLDSKSSTIKNWEMLGMFLVTTGGGIGLLCFGPLSEWIGRRWAFIFFHIGGLVSALTLFQALPQSPLVVLLVALPIFGFLSLGMHAGYAIYFPELFPTRLRGTGGGFCFNMGRILVPPILLLTGWLQLARSEGGVGLSLNAAASLLSLLFIIGAILPLFAPETRGQELPK